MTTLELITTTTPYKFKSLGIPNHSGKFSESTDFPIGREYELTDGKFPLTSHEDMFKHSGKYHTLDNIQVKITGFNTSCGNNGVDLNQYGSCTITVEKEQSSITVEKEQSSGGKKRGSKNKSKRRKSKRRKSKRRKSKRRR